MYIEIIGIPIPNLSRTNRMFLKDQPSIKEVAKVFIIGKLPGIYLLIYLLIT